MATQMCISPLWIQHRHNINPASGLCFHPLSVLAPCGPVALYILVIQAMALCLTDNRSLRDYVKWNLNQNKATFTEDDAFEKVFCKIAAILFRPWGHYQIPGDNQNRSEHKWQIPVTNSQIPQCTFFISHNAPFKTEMCIFLFWMVHCGIWNRCIAGFVKLVYYLLSKCR